MKKVVIGSILTLSFGAFTALADQWTGYVSESHCGAMHDKVSAKNTACIKKCLGNGSDPVLVSNGNVMKFDSTSKDKITAFAGKMVTVNGTMENDQIKVESVEPASTK